MKRRDEADDSSRGPKRKEPLEDALATYGLPRLTGTFAYALFMANAAIGALVMHCVLFWGKDVVQAFRDSRNATHSDPHHAHMAKHYKEVPWWCTLLYARFGNGIATNNLSKMIAGLAVPGRPVGNMYFATWSHNVITNTVNLCNDLKIGEYLKIPPRTMFLTQIYGTILGGFVSYAVAPPRLFKNYLYLVTGAFDGASLTVLFILSFAVFGAGGRTVPFPTWWGNNADGYYDLCPS